MYTYTHDPDQGYITSMPHLPLMDWNYKDELVAVSRQQGANPEITYYQYDSQGRRLRKVTEYQGSGPPPGQKDQRIYLEGYEYYENFNSGEQIHSLSLKDERQRFVMVEKTNIPGYHLLVRYLHDSHQGSCTLETDESGNVITYEEYHPFGTSSYQATNAGILSSSKRYRFCSKERDSESGLYYYGARYYVPWLCRFISCDPKVGETPQQSPYNYCNNNPINLIDPDGQQAVEPNDPPPVQNPQHGDSRTINGCTDYWDSNAADGKGAWVDMPEVEVVAQKSNASKEWKDFITNLGPEGYNNFVTELYESKLAPYKQDTGLNRGFYGTDELGNINVPDSIKDKLRGEAEKEAMPTLKAMWATEKSGIDPNSLNYAINPLARAHYLSTRALAVSSTEEGKELVGNVLADVSMQWLGRFTAFKQRVPNSNLNQTIFQKGNGKQFRIDWDSNRGLHYHRRGLNKDGTTIPGQGIGRHRPWDKKSTDKTFIDRW
jgi:RHS repeat-associated protein